MGSVDQKLYDSLKGKYKHWCYEYDGLPIDEFSVEFHCCGCFRGKRFESAKKKNAKLHKEYWDRIKEYWDRINPPIETTPPLTD